MRNEIEQQPDEHHSVDWATTRPVVSGSGGVISSGHPLVSMAGMRMLLSGGNAFDAAAAAGFAAAVIEPTASYSLCSECVAILHDTKGHQTLVLSGQGTAPALATIATFARSGFPRIPTGPGPDAHLSFTVPGAVGAYLKLLETFGTRPIVEVLAPALGVRGGGLPDVRIHAPHACRIGRRARNLRSIPLAAKRCFIQLGGRRGLANGSGSPRSRQL